MVPVGRGINQIKSKHAAEIVTSEIKAFLLKLYLIFTFILETLRVKLDHLKDQFNARVL